MLEEKVNGKVYYLKAYDLRYRYLDIINFLSLFKD